MGVESQCSFSATIQTGRCWAFDSITTVPTGTDGYAVGDEISIVNHGSDQPSINHPSTKIGLHLVAGGDAPSTAGIVLSAVKGVHWHDALVVKRSAVSDYAVVVRDDAVGTFDPVASISMSGDAAFHDVAMSGALRRGGAQRDVPTTGGRVAIQMNTDTEILAPNGSIDAVRVSLPVGRPGADLRILCVGRISHLGVSAPGAAIHGLSDMPCEPGRGHEYSYYPVDGWIQIY